MHPIERYCRENDYSYAEVARQAGLTRQAIHAYVTGRYNVSARAATRLHDKCGIDLEALLRWRPRGAKT